MAADLAQIAAGGIEQNYRGRRLARLAERQIKARAEYAEAIEALTPDSTDEEAEAAVRLLVAAGLSPRTMDRAAGRLKEALDAKAMTIRRMIKAAEEEVAAERQAGGAVGAEASPPAWFSPPPADRGSFDLRMVGSRRWICRGDLPLTTAFALTGGIRHPDASSGGDCALRVILEDEYGAEAVVEVDAADLVRGGGMPALERLRAAGLCYTQAGADFLLPYLRETQPTGALHFHRPGFRDGAFILPTGGALLTDRDLGLSAQARLTCAATAGTLDGWKAGAKFVLENGGPAMAASIFIGAVGPLVDLGGFDSVTFTFEGSSSAAKSTGGQLGAALWADPKLGAGLFVPIKGSVNALEGPIERGSGTYVAFDEDQQIVGGPQALQELAFMVQAGMGKRRGLPRQGEQRLRTWRTCVSVSGETGLGQKLAGAGIRRANGVSARVIAINVDQNPDLTANWSKVEAAISNFGHAGPRFIQALADLGYVDEPDRLRAAVEKHQSTLTAHKLPKNTPVKLQRLRRRAARLVALVWMAADVMKSADLIPATFNSERMALAIWEAALEADIAPRDPVQRAIDALRESIAANLHHTIVGEGETYNDGSPRPRFREPDGFIETLPQDKRLRVDADRKRARRAPWVTHSTDVYVIRASRLSELAGATLPDRTLRSALVEHDIAIPMPGTDRNTWDSFPGRGRAQYVVLRRDQIDD